MLIEVAFKGNRKEFFLWESDEPPPVKAAVIVDADRGEDLGYVHAAGERAGERAKGVPHRPTEEEAPKVARRLATAEEEHRERELRQQDDVARRKAMDRVKANGLTMKLSDAEWRWDRRKLTIYFTAEKRVDFRTLVRELASMFRTRIELKQIGVRDEARRLSGIGRCGREYCSASWLPELRPVNLGVAKDQRLSLNPTQISGACGRLMCCLRYEHDFYVQQRKRFPKEGRSIETSRGEEKVVANDIFRERVTLRNGEGEVRVVSLVELRHEWKSPPTAPLMDEDTPPIPYEAISDEVLRLQDTSELPAWHPGLTRGAVPLRPARGLPVVEEPKTSGRVDEELKTKIGRREDEKTSRREDEEQKTRRREDEQPRGREDESAPPRSQSDATGDALTSANTSKADSVGGTDNTANAADRPDAPGSTDERAQRPRRRRGRRGGRRSRGEQDPSPPPGGGPSGGPANDEPGDCE